jgi:phosphoglycerate dehydrogenase-like enzyme
MIVPALDDTDRRNILEAAGPGSTLIEAKDPAVQRKEIGDTEALFGRVANDLFVTAKRLRYYHSIGAGVDAILTPELVNSDVILASEKGEVGIHLAEHAFALLLTITRGIHTALRKPDYSLREPIRKEQWELHDQTLGIVGFGGTGRAVAQRAHGFGMKVLAVDIDDVPGMAGVTLWKSDRLGDLLGQSDVVVICLPLTKATRHMFSRDLFRRMRRHAILVNVTRGAIVFGDDLLAALDEGLIGGAGLDVTDLEPLPAGHRLWTHPRAVVTRIPPVAPAARRPRVATFARTSAACAPARRCWRSSTSKRLPASRRRGWDWLRSGSLHGSTRRSRFGPALAGLHLTGGARGQVAGTGSRRSHRAGQSHPRRQSLGSFGVEWLVGDSEHGRASGGGR